MCPVVPDEVIDVTCPREMRKELVKTQESIKQCGQKIEHLRDRVNQNMSKGDRSLFSTAAGLVCDRA